MGYLHIDNLHKNQSVLMFKRVYALEKVHGTSAHVSFKDGKLNFFAGGEKHDKFVGLFDKPALLAMFEALGHESVIVFGEAYGGKRRGIEEDKVSEGIVIRPLIELRLPNGERCIVKYKNEQFSERASKADTRVVDPEKQKVLEDAQDIAQEWVTDMRLHHVLDKLPQDFDISGVPVLIKAMQEDIERESHGEVVLTKQVSSAIGAATVKLFKAHLSKKLQSM